MMESSTTRPLRTVEWKFGRADDPNFTGMPVGWVRYRGIGFPNFVRSDLVAKDPQLEKRVQRADAWLINTWQSLQEQSTNYPWLSRLPAPPSVGDLMVDRYLRIKLDGGQFKLESPTVDASRQYQYQLSCDVMTESLRYDSVRIEFVFLDASNKEIAVRSSPPVSGTRDWERLAVKMVRPPIGVSKMAVRLIVERSQDGFEDIRGAIGFDNVQINQFPQLRVTTDKLKGIYQANASVQCQASVLGLGRKGATVNFQLLDERGKVLDNAKVGVTSSIKLSQREPEMAGAVKAEPAKMSAAKMGAIKPGAVVPNAADGDVEDSNESRVHWKTHRLDPGFYRVVASIAHPRSTANLGVSAKLAEMPAEMPTEMPTEMRNDCVGP